VEYQDWGVDYFPLKQGSRFSTKALEPSRWSSVVLQKEKAIEEFRRGEIN
jgi:hypothetical protein